MKRSNFKWAAALAAAICFSLYGGVGAEAAIHAEKAQAIAVKHAGVDADSIYASRVKTDYEHGRQIYEVEFFADGTEYDYDIDAETGDILKSSQDFKRHHRRHDAQGDIGIEAAKAKALARVPGAPERHLHIRKDLDHGRRTYEGEIHHDGYEYEFEIDAATGEFLEWSKEKM